MTAMSAAPGHTTRRGKKGRKMMRVFPLSTYESRYLPAHEKVSLLRWALRRRWPHLRLGYAPRKRPVLRVVGGTDAGHRAERP